MNILALLGGKPKGAAEAAPEGEEAPAEGPERMFAREAFGALKDDDEEGFVSSFVSAVRACSKKSYSEPGADELEE